MNQPDLNARINALKQKCVIAREWVGDHRRVDYLNELQKLFSAQRMEIAHAEISDWPGYRPTSLRDLPLLAKAADIEALHYKDESERFGLGSFKALGGAFAVLRYLSERLAAELGRPVSMREVREGKFAKQAAEFTVASATDGNHGRSVAWGAQQAGCRCKIYIHRDVSQGREEAMTAFGADVIRIDGDYDESVRFCASESDKNNWQVISDTSYGDYTEVPRDVMAGYTMMAREILDQSNQAPTHIFIQAGVGGFAGAVSAALWQMLGENCPRVVIVESDRAACILESFNNGRPSHVQVHEETIMAGLSCGEISLIAWDILKERASAVLTLEDDAVPPAMRVMADLEVEAGECAVPGIVALLAASKDAALREKLDLGPQSRVLVFGCEGATDPELYHRIIAGDDIG